MSLLAGIKFVPKKEREASHSDKKRKKDKKEDKKHKKRHRDERSESDNDNSADERRKHSSSRRRYDEKKIESSDDDEEEMFRQLREQDEPRRQVRFDEPTKPAFDPNKFRSLLAGLTQKSTGNDNDVTLSSPPSITTKQSDAIGTTAGDYNYVEQESNYEPSTVSVGATTGTNKGAAEFLRQRLQQSRKAPTLPTISSSSTATDKGGYDIDKARSNMLIHAKTQQKRQERAGEASISALMTAERFADDADMDQTFTRNILRLGDRYQGIEGGRAGDRSGIDEEQAVDMSMYQRHNKDSKGNDQDPTQMLRQQLQQANKDRERRQHAISSCRVCSSLSSSSNMDISRGEFFMLRLKTANFRLAPTHLELVSLPHAPSLLHVLDEDEVIQAEYKRFVGCVRAMFRAQGRVAIITEAAVTLDHKQHCILDVIPVETQLVDEVLMSFRVAFLGEGDEWASAQRRAISLTNQRPITRAVPKNFPYLSVLYDDEDNGLAHPVEKDMSKEYHGFFCYDVLAGVLEEDEARMRKNRPNTETLQDREKLVKEVKRQFEAYDWTDLGS